MKINSKVPVLLDVRIELGTTFLKGNFDDINQELMFLDLITLLSAIHMTEIITGLLRAGTVIAAFTYI